jgi:cephalosporin hydroxylase
VNQGAPEPAADALVRLAGLIDDGRYAEALPLAATLRETAADADGIVQRLIERSVAACLRAQHEPSAAGERYHRWYYDNLVWMTTSYLGIPIRKSPSDMWNYHEILCELRPRLVVEFGTFSGASALFFANVMRAAGTDAYVLTVDVDLSSLAPAIQADPAIEAMHCSSTDPAVAERIAALRRERPGPVFAILDSDHSMNHVLGELLILRPLLVPGDYLVVEDSNINGHPVLPDWGPGPYEAATEYFARFPNDYERDVAREHKFGYTFATNGFLKRIG